LGKTLNSVANQDWPFVEHVLIDGASTDDTKTIINQFSPKIDYVLSEPDSGIYDAMNKGISNASGEVIGFLNSDDIFFSDDVLSNVAAVFEADKSISAVYGDLQYVKKSGFEKIVRNWRSNSFSRHLLSRGWMPPHPTLYLRREWYEHIGGFDVRYSISADYFSVLQLFSQPNFKAVYLPKVMVKMSVGGASNRSLGAILRKSAEDWDALKCNGFGFFGATRALVFKNLSKAGQFFSHGNS
jgi:glycosyltransferase